MLTRARFGFGALVVTLASGAAHAQTIAASFTGGSLHFNGSATNFVDDFDSDRFLGTVNPLSASASGSSSSGLVTSSGSLQATITQGTSATTVAFVGNAVATIPAGNAGSANVEINSETFQFEPNPLVLTISEPLDFAVTSANMGTFASITLSAGTGTITGNRLSPGTYRLAVRLAAFLSVDPPVAVLRRQTASIDWTLRLTRPGAACRADFDGTGGVQVTDIFAFLSAWFSNNPRADLDGGGITVTDIFVFLREWFAGC